MSANVTTKDQMIAALEAVKALRDVIKLRGEIPSGELYAMVMQYVNLSTYNSMIDILIKSGVVKQTNFMLTWTGPR